MNKTILAETKRAYCEETRNLNFRASKSVPVLDAVTIMCAALGCKDNESGYNNFKPGFLLALPQDANVTLAREGSVCVYVKLPKGHTLKLDARTQRAMMIDEYHPQKDGSVRLWWD